MISLLPDILESDVYMNMLIFSARFPKQIKNGKKDKWENIR